MSTIVDDKFDVLNASSKGFSDHQAGKVPFVTNGTDNNGIVGFVKPLPKERVFNEKAICVSSFCEATVQEPPFLPRGNGGSGLIVLVPRKTMTIEELYSYAAQINFYKWRFSFGRMVTADRLKSFPLTENIVSGNVAHRVHKLTAKQQERSPSKLKGSLTRCTIDNLFEVGYGQKEYESKEGLEPGKTILISSKGEDKGCYGFFNIEPFYEAPIITVPRTGTIGHAFVQEYDCCANSDCLILKPRKEAALTLLELRQIAFQIRGIKWKFNYGRKITPERLKREFVYYASTI